MFIFAASVYEMSGDKYYMETSTTSCKSDRGHLYSLHLNSLK